MFLIGEIYWYKNFERDESYLGVGNFVFSFFVFNWWIWRGWWFVLFDISEVNYNRYFKFIFVSEYVKCMFEYVDVVMVYENKLGWICYDIWYYY